jgi:hypothetical protein
MSSYYYIYVLILPYMGPHTTTWQEKAKKAEAAAQKAAAAAEEKAAKDAAKAAEKVPHPHTLIH